MNKMAAKDAPRHYAGFVSRLLAFVIDLILITVVTFLVTVGLGLIASFFGLDTSISSMMAYLNTAQSGLTPLQKVVTLIAGLFGTFFGLIYFLFFWVLIGFTPGMGLLGLRLIRCNGQPLGLGRAIIRLIGYWVSLIFLGLGFLWILVDNRRQGWHDKLAGSCVVYFD